MKMNKKQLFVVWAGIIAIVLMGIFPPMMVQLESSKAFRGYDFIVPNVRSLTVIDFTRLLTQWIIVLALMTGLLITFQNKSD